MGERVVLLEFEDEADSFLGYCRNHGISPNNFHIIALQPRVQVFLKNRDVPYENTLLYFSNESHARALLKSEEWVRFLAERLNLEVGTEIKETYNDAFLFFVRFYIHHFLMYAEIISEICKKHEVESIYACLYRNDFRPHDPPRIQDSERFVGIVAKKFSQTHNISFCEIPIQLQPITVKKDRSLSSSFRESAEKILSKLFKLLWAKYLNRREVILLTTTGYNVGNLAQGLKKEFPDAKWVEISLKKPSRCMVEFFADKLSKMFKIYQVGYLLDARLPIESSRSVDSPDFEAYRRLEKEINNVVKQLENDWFDRFTYHNVNFVEVMVGKIKKDLKPFLLKLHSEFMATKEILGHLNVRLLVSPFARDRTLIIGETCRRRGIPTLIIAHGTLIEPKNELEKIEYFHIGTSLSLSKGYSYVALQTPSLEQHFQSYRPDNTPIRTGNLIFSKIDPRRKEEIKKKILGASNVNKKVLLYPENVRERPYLRFHTFETFDEFLSSATDLVNAVNEVNNVHFVIRLHPGRKLTAAEFKSLLPESNNLTIDTSETPFFEILTIADLMVNFSSTVIEDALQNYISVLLYDKRKRYMHFESQELGPNITPKLNAVYYINEPSYLKRGLQWILDNHLNAPSVPKSIFEKYVYKENYYNNLVRFISDKLRDG